MYVYVLAAVLAYAIFFWKSEETPDYTFLDLRPLKGTVSADGRVLVTTRPRDSYQVGPYTYKLGGQKLAEDLYAIDGWDVYKDGVLVEQLDATLTRDGIQHLIIEQNEHDLFYP